jgi:hypothetical protein
MKFATLKAIGHNIADSLASGIGLMIGVYSMDVFGEAAAAKPGYIDVDFILGTTAGSPASRQLRKAVSLYSSKALPSLCEKHRIDLKQVKTISARFEVHPVAGRHFTVTVENKRGKRSIDQYVGVPGRRLRRREGERIETST